jgi:hypothetical protein
MSRKRHFEPAYKLPSGQKVSFRCVGEEEIATLRTWVPYAHKGSTTVQREAGKMAENALRDWNAAQREQLTACSMEDAEDRKKVNPHNDTFLFLCLVSEQFQHGKVLGFVFAKRNWRDGLFVDYIAVHPLVAKNPESGYEGVGTLVFLGMLLLARNMNIREIIGEPTPFSIGFYKFILNRSKIPAAVVISRRKYENVLQNIEPTVLFTESTESTESN